MTRADRGLETCLIETRSLRNLTKSSPFSYRKRPLTTFDGLHRDHKTINEKSLSFLRSNFKLVATHALKIDVSFVYFGDYILIGHVKWSFSISKLQVKFTFKEYEFYDIRVHVF